MKTFWIAIAIFTTMLFIIISNYLYIITITDNLYTMLQSIPLPTSPQCICKIEAFKKYWERNCDIINLSTSAAKTDSISNDIIKLKCLASEFDASNFEVTRHQILNAINNIKKTEILSFNNII